MRTSGRWNTGEQAIVGVNKFTVGKEPTPDLLRVDGGD